MKKIVVLLGLFLMLSGCSTYLAQSHNVSKEKKEYQKVLVLARSQNRIARSLFERDMTEFLTSRGITATPSINSGIEIPMEGQISETQAESVGQRLQEEGYDVSYYPATSWEPDRLVTGTRHVLESTLYDLRETAGDNLQWVGSFVVEDPANIEKATQKYAQELGKALMESSMKAARQ